MNEIITGLYEIEEQAGRLMEDAAARRRELLEENRRKMESSEVEMEKEMEGRLSILRSQLEGQTAGEIQQLVEKNQVQIAQINESYGKNLNQFAQEIVKKIIEV